MKQLLIELLARTKKGQSSSSSRWEEKEPVNEDEENEDKH